MPSVEVCKERGIWEYSCGSDGPCTQSPTGNCKGRCEDAVRLAARRAPPVGEQLGCDDDGEAQSQRHGRDGSLGKRDGRVARHGPLRDLLHLGNLEAWTRGLDTVIAKCRIATGSTRAQKGACRSRAEGVGPVLAAAAEAGRTQQRHQIGRLLARREPHRHVGYDRAVRVWDATDLSSQPLQKLRFRAIRRRCY